MCFSAQISFISSGLLISIGIASIVKIIQNKLNKLTLFYGSIPILFSLQQLAEGFLWTNISYQKLAYIFLSIAFIVWPIWMPTSILFLNDNNKKINIYILGFLILCGSIWSSFVIYLFISYGAYVDIGSNNLIYHVPIPFNYNEYLAILIYNIIAIFPFFLSNIRSVIFLGILTIISCIITISLSYYSFISIWCFFAALISLGIYYSIPNNKNLNKI